MKKLKRIQINNYNENTCEVTPDRYCYRRFSGYRKIKLYVYIIIQSYKFLFLYSHHLTQIYDTDIINSTTGLQIYNIEVFIMWGDFCDVYSPSKEEDNDKDK